MGEYALYRGNRIKIGSDTDLHSLRFDDRFKVIALPNNIDPVNDAHDCTFRLPLPQEDSEPIGDYPGQGHVLLYTKTAAGYHEHYSPDSLEPSGIVQATTKHGLLINIACHHGTKLPQAGGDIAKVFWNGRAPHIALTALRCRRAEHTPSNLTLTPIIMCLACRTRWYMTWDELLLYVHGDLKQRLLPYAQNDRLPVTSDLTTIDS